MSDDSSWFRDDNFPMPVWASEVEAGECEVGYMPWVVSRYIDYGLPLPQEVQDEAHRQSQLLPTLSDYALSVLSPRYEREHWMAEVIDEDTRLGYRDWVFHQAEMDEDVDWEALVQVEEHSAALQEATPGLTRPSPLRRV